MNWRGGRINPEKLWAHYALALCLIVGLLATVFGVNQMLVTEGRKAAKAIETGERFAIVSQQILLRAAENDADQVLTLARKLRADHLSIFQGEVWSPALDAHYRAGAVSLEKQLRDFVHMAERFAWARPATREGILVDLKVAHDDEGLFDALVQTATLLKQASAERIDGLRHTSRSLLIITVITIIGEALLIFWPAQINVRTAIAELRRQADLQRSTQAQLQRMNDKLHHIASHDPLTGLPNRAKMVEFIQAQLEKDPAIDIGVVLVGLDDFKAINEAIGHTQADDLLVLVADALQNCVDDDDLVARIGGDEFFMTTTEPAEVLVKRVKACFAEPFIIEGRKVNIGASIGYLDAYRGNEVSEDVLGNVAVALQTAKAQGRRLTVSFSQELREAYATMQELQQELPHAIKSGQIEPWFQPQINLSDGSLRGAEVLARWRHPKLGLLTPDRFLPAAEQAGLTIEMDHAIWGTALRFAEGWQGSGFEGATISLNAAPETMSDPNLIERFLSRMHKSTLSVNQVIIEVLETTLIEGADDIAAINIDSLAECGVALELDDFGTGYASLSRLIQLPLSGIKLDRSLVAPLPDTNADSVVRAILALAGELDLQVVAEGVEEYGQAQHLTGSGCMIGQGYGFARPMPADEFATWLKTFTNHPMMRPSDQTGAMRA